MSGDLSRQSGVFFRARALAIGGIIFKLAVRIFPFRQREYTRAEPLKISYFLNYRLIYWGMQVY